MTLLRGENAEEIEFGCKFGDLICVAFEAQARGLGSFLGWLAELVLGSQDLAPGTVLWESAIDEAGNWFAVSILVMLATGVIALATGMLSMKKQNVLIAVGGLAAAVPSTYLALGLGGELLKISDQFSDLALERLGGPDGFSNIFRAATQGGTGSDLAGFAVMKLTGGTANALPTMLMLILLIIGLILMSFAIAFRNLGIMILIAFAPLAFMAVPMKGGWGITKKWALAGIALLLSKPLMFGVLAMLLKSAEGMALFSRQTLSVAAGLFVVCLMPMMAYDFFSFLGSGNANQAGQNLGSSVAQKAGQPAQQAVSIVTTRRFGGIGGMGKPGVPGGAGSGNPGKPGGGGTPGKPGGGGTPGNPGGGGAPGKPGEGAPGGSGAPGQPGQPGGTPPPNVPEGPQRNDPEPKNDPPSGRPKW